jgi:peptide deformylase
VTRAEKITVQFQDLEGQTLVVEAEGMFARVLQHEIDHLNGKLFIDYISEASKSLIKPKLKEIAERYS